MSALQISGYFDILTRSQKIYSRLLEPVCRKWDLTRSEVDVLLFLYNNPGFDRAADIVNRRGMAKSHVSMSVASLENRGLLERHFSSTDRRISHLRLTPAGANIAKEARQVQKEFAELLHRGIGPEEMKIWNSIGQKIQKNILDFDKT